MCKSEKIETKLITVEDFDKFDDYITHCMEQSTLFGAYVGDIVKMEINNVAEFLRQSTSVIALEFFPVCYQEDDYIVLESCYDSGEQDRIYCTAVYTIGV